MRLQRERIVLGTSSQAKRVPGLRKRLKKGVLSHIMEPPIMPAASISYIFSYGERIR
jgi:hypothetical protein